MEHKGFKTRLRICCECTTDPELKLCRLCVMQLGGQWGKTLKGAGGI